MSTKYDVIEENRRKRLQRASSIVFWITLSCAIIIFLFIKRPEALAGEFPYPFNILVPLFLALISFVLMLVLVVWLGIFSLRSAHARRLARRHLISAVRSTEVEGGMEQESEKPLPAFYANEPLPDPGELYGRDDAYSNLLRQIRSGSSALILGSAKVGKTWLIERLKLSAETDLGVRYCIAHVAATRPNSFTAISLMNGALEQFGYEGFIIDDDMSQSVDDILPQTINALKRAVEDLKKQGKVPVLCIDDFERFNDPSFNARFFKDLREIAQNGLVLIICSRLSLSGLTNAVGKQARTSKLGDILPTIRIGPFDQKKASGFLLEKCHQMKFTPPECVELERYCQNPRGKWAPLRLQLAGQILWEDKERIKRDPTYWYNPVDSKYWNIFKKRLEKAYSEIAPPDSRG